MKVEKVITKCHAMCQKELDALNKAYDETLANYQDTGYDKYYKKMGVLEEEIEKMEKFINGDAIAKAEASRYKRMYSEIKDALFYINKMLDNLTDEDFTSPRINEIINQLHKMKGM